MQGQAAIDVECSMGAPEEPTGRPPTIPRAHNTSQENRGHKDCMMPKGDTDSQQLAFTIYKEGDGKNGEESDVVHAHESANDPIGKAKTQQKSQN